MRRDPNMTCSEDRSGFSGPLKVTTQIHEGTNQIQRVVIAKRLVGELLRPARRWVLPTARATVFRA